MRFKTKEQKFITINSEEIDRDMSLRQIKGLFDHDLKYPRPAPGDFL